ncbi:MAG: amidophosphoribosyltransferase [Bacteroidia bacterium]
MSELIKHECGIGLIRLFKPLSYYEEKYGSPLWGLNKMYLLMEKQRNRGQDGAGISAVKIHAEPGRHFMTRRRSVDKEPWVDIFNQLDKELAELKRQFPNATHDADWHYKRFPFAGEVLMGHLRYGTHGTYGIEACHPVTRTSNWRNNNLTMAGNFNLTGVNDQFRDLVDIGQHPRALTDTEIVLEKVGWRLDKQVRSLNGKAKKEKLKKRDRAQYISENIDLVKLLRTSAENWDGGYVMGGIIGSGDCFIARDPHAIRPCYYYFNDEFMVAASERAAMVTIFGIHPDEILELGGGQVLHVKHHSTEVKVDSYLSKINGKIPKYDRKSCSFERIYFSRNSDIKIYQERKELGRVIVPKILDAVEQDIENTVFSYIPNTAETAFLGMMEGLEGKLNEYKSARIQEIFANETDPETRKAKLDKLLALRPRMEKSVSKDVKMRTFITDDSSRDDLVSHVYDITQGIIRPGKDNLVVIDDSIVRGTTLQRSILHMLARLNPRKVVVVSSAPQIRYPDCYGIDMAHIGKLIAFRAAIALLRESGRADLIDKVYEEAKTLHANGELHTVNLVKQIYDPFTPEEIAAKIAELVSPEDYSPELEVVFQSLESLHAAIPNHPGDWYFSGDYPTPGGTRVVNLAFMNYYEGKNTRAYDAEIA